MQSRLQLREVADEISESARESGLRCCSSTWQPSCQQRGRFKFSQGRPKFKLNLSGLSVVENNSKVPMGQLAHFSPAWQIYAGAEVFKLDLSSNAISESPSHGPTRLRLGVCGTAAPRRAGHPAPACMPDVTVVTVTAVDGRPGEGKVGSQRPEF